jgi:chemotaxis protein histidine kinase CheA/ActR/RegA family two-component response regulator
MASKIISAAIDTSAPNRTDALNWVSVEVRKSMSIAVAAVSHTLDIQNSADKNQKNNTTSHLATAPNLKSAEIEMQRASGALKMLEQFACADICKDIGTILQHIKQNEQAIKPELLKAIKSSQYAVSAFLTGMENGKSWPETVLLPVVEIIALHAKRHDLHPAQWWVQSHRLVQIDLPIKWSVFDIRPKALETGEVDAALLLLLKSDKSSLDALIQACFEVAKKRTETRLQELSFWTITFLQALKNSDFTLDKYVKRTISRAIRLVLDDNPGLLQANVLDALQAELKYFVGAWYSFNPELAPKSGKKTLKNALVKSSFIQALFDNRQLVAVDQNYWASSQAFKVKDPDLLSQVDLLIQTVKEYWSQLSVNVMNRPSNLSLAFNNLHKIVNHLWPELATLTQALVNCIEKLIKDEQAVSPSLALEVATTLLFLEDTIADVYSSDPDVKVKTEVMFHRLQQVSENQDAPNLLPWMEALFRRSGDHQTIGNVAGELKQLVSEIERNFETVFANHKNPEALTRLTTLLNQMRGVLSVVGLDDAVQAVIHLRKRLDSIEVDLQNTNTRAILVQNIASNVATLGLMVDMLIYQPKLPAKVFRFDVQSMLLSMTTSTANNKFESAQHSDPLYSEAAITSTFGRPLNEQVWAQRSVNNGTKNIEETSSSLHSEDEQALKQFLDSAISTSAQKKKALELNSAFAENKELDGEMRGVFTDEAQDVVEQGLGAVSALQLNAKDVEKLVSLRRGFHTLKGSARMVGLKELGDAAWSMEQLLNEQLTNDTHPVSDNLRLLAQEALNLIGQWSAMVAAGQDPDWKAQPFVDSAQQMRQNGQYQSIGHVLKGAINFESKVEIPKQEEKVDDAYSTSIKSESITEKNTSSSDQKNAAIPPKKTRQTKSSTSSVTTTAPSNLATSLQVPKVTSSQLTGSKATDRSSKNKKLDITISEFESNQGFTKLNEDLTTHLDQTLAVVNKEDDKNIHDIPPISVIDFDLSEIEALVNTGENKKKVGATEELENGLDHALSVPKIDEEGLVFANSLISVDTDQLLGPNMVTLQTKEHDHLKIELVEDSKNLSIKQFNQENQAAVALEGIDFEQLDWQESPKDDLLGTQKAVIQNNSEIDILQAIKDIDLSLEDQPQSNTKKQSNEISSDLDDIFADIDFTEEKKSDAPDSVMNHHNETNLESFDFLNETTASRNEEKVLAISNTSTNNFIEMDFDTVLSNKVVSLAEVDTQLSDFNSNSNLNALPLIDLSKNQSQPVQSEPTLDSYTLDPSNVVNSKEIVVATTLNAPGLTLDNASDLIEPLQPIEPTLLKDELIEDTTEKKQSKSHSQTVMTSQLNTGPSESEQYKLVGHLRIKFDLYSIFLQEADEKSRELDTVIGEWMLERDKTIPPEAEECAHFLAGCSATVGLVSLSSLARLVEKVCSHVKSWKTIEEEEIQTIKQAVDAVRYLLHQFAAGFLKEPDSVLIAQLQRLCFVRRTTESEPVKVISAASSAQAPGADPNAIHQVLKEVAKAGLDFDNSSDNPEEVVAELPDNEFNLPIDILDTELLGFFLEESRDLLPQLMRNSRVWTSDYTNRESKTEVLRGLHTLKGSARLAGAYRLGEIVHRLEAEVESIPDQALSPEQVDDLLAWFDHVEIEVEHLANLQENPSLGYQASANRLTIKPKLIDTGVEPELISVPAAVIQSQKNTALSDAFTFPPESTQPAINTTEFLADIPVPSTLVDPQFSEKVASHASEILVADTTATTNKQVVRVSAKLLDQLMNQAGEVLSSRARVETEVSKLKSSLSELTLDVDRLRVQLRELEIQAESQMQSRLTLQKDTETQFDPLEFDRFTRVQELVRVMAESVSDVATVQRGIARNVDLATDELVSQGRQARELQRTILRTRMVEFDLLSERLHRTTRQAAKDVDKKVSLEIEGGSLELDRQLLDKVGPCLEHLIRNAVAHGIETPSDRLKVRKSELGQIHIGISHDRNDVFIQFRDDGRGLDLDSIYKKAIQVGLLQTNENNVNLEKAFELICSQGFSTATEITEISGRGIGMDVVRSAIDALGGRMEVANEKGRGFGLRLVLPLTTATTQVLLVRCENTITAIQVGMVEQVLRYSQKELLTAYEKGTVTYSQEQLNFYWAGALFGGSKLSNEANQKTVSVVIVRSAGRRLAIHVDEVLNNQEVIVKNLGPQLSQLPGLTGVTILPSGDVVFIYNPVALALVYAEKLKVKQKNDIIDNSNNDASANTTKKPLVMVVDDSITVRRVTERLLQRLGYRVVSAADGLQALSLLRDDYSKDLPCVVLADIEMPRMDGFDLLRSIRANENLKPLPVIMITSRLAEKHKELAFSLGVNHYLGKPYSEEELSHLIANYSGFTKKQYVKS